MVGGWEAACREAGAWSHARCIPVATVMTQSQRHEHDAGRWRSEAWRSRGELRYRVRWQPSGAKFGIGCSRLSACKCFNREFFSYIQITNFWAVIHPFFPSFLSGLAFSFLFWLGSATDSSSHTPNYYPFWWCAFMYDWLMQAIYAKYSTRRCALAQAHHYGWCVRFFFFFFSYVYGDWHITP